MARLRPLDSYPNAQFSALVRRVLEAQAPVMIPASPAQAASLRGEIYAWRRAIERSPQEAFALNLPTVAEGREVAYRITGEGMEAVLASTLVNPQLIEAVLGPTALGPTPAEKALAALRAGLASAEGEADGS
jgi:hypothetical protein